jgi:hypothetical protein
MFDVSLSLLMPDIGVFPPFYFIKGLVDLVRPFYKKNLFPVITGLLFLPRY